MALGGKESQILYNMQRENCIGESVEADFFKNLASKGTPGEPKEAHRFAGEVAVERADDGTYPYLCSGAEVPKDEFSKLFRVMKTTRINELVRTETAAQIGIEEEDLEKGLKEDSLKELVAFVNRENETVMLGREERPVVWVTDYGKVGALLRDYDKMPYTLINMLGMSHFSKEGKCLTVLYDREGMGESLHAPRVLDALYFPEFMPVLDCAAHSGKTRPLEGVENDGLPEAVHLFCETALDRFEVRIIHDDA